MRRLTKGILILVLPVLLLAGLNIFIDPYFHFHKPVEGISYILENERYQNDGILRNFDYDIILTGTSIDQNEKVSEANQLFGGKAVKVPFSGAYLPELSATLDRALERKSVKRIVMSLGYSVFTESEYNYWGNEGFKYPQYLYDNNMFNDVKYFFNMSTLNMTIRNLMNTIRGIDSTSFDEYSNWSQRETLGKESVLETYHRTMDEDKKSVDKVGKEEIIRKNIKENLVNLANKYPDTEFDFYLPPYNILFWYTLKQNNLINNKINGIKAVIEELLNCKNVVVYYFINEWDIITDFNNYADMLHYGENINSFILRKIKNNENSITRDNYEEFIKKSRIYYNNYKYTQLWK